ncbi:hypothetical protein [Streptomyces sp. WMMB303]|uniref:hypothetical protein n=1 Tax=Streptomyces sp. WMMB303 TaxID=3034154 RepID=UPI0023EDCC3C|nr:hypothetical protein [Streptomyces sp. WMMB303]MDF4250094.1 hypothetical protein [Streptomyces sp. WMMB303]
MLKALIRTALCAVVPAALLMAAPGEIALAESAGWSPMWSPLMPVILSVYAALTAGIASVRPDIRSAKIGAAFSMTVAVSAQVTAHLLSADYMSVSPGLVVAVSAIPPVVAGHLLHMAASVATPQTATGAPESTAPVSEPSETQNGAQASAQRAPCTSFVPLADLVATIPSDSRPDICADTWSIADLLATFPATEADTAMGDLGQVATGADNGRPDADTIRAAIAVLSASGRTVTGEDLAAHFGVSARTGRRYLSKATAGVV